MDLQYCTKVRKNTRVFESGEAKYREMRGGLRVLHSAVTATKCRAIKCDV